MNPQNKRITFYFHILTVLHSHTKICIIFKINAYTLLLLRIFLLHKRIHRAQDQKHLLGFCIEKVLLAISKEHSCQKTYSITFLHRSSGIPTYTQPDRICN